MHGALGVLAQPRAGGGSPTSGSGHTLLRGTSDIWNVHNRALKLPHFNTCEMNLKSGWFGEKSKQTTLQILKEKDQSGVRRHGGASKSVTLKIEPKAAWELFRFCAETTPGRPGETCPTARVKRSLAWQGPQAGQCV